MTKKNNIPKAYFNHNGTAVEIDQKDIVKYEVAEELGVLDKALEKGWKSLSAKETGKIGGLISKRKREESIGTYKDGNSCDDSTAKKEREINKQS